MWTHLTYQRATRGRRGIWPWMIVPGSLSGLRLGVSGLCLQIPPTCKAEQVTACLSHTLAPHCPQENVHALHHCYTPQPTTASWYPRLHHTESFPSSYLSCSLSPLSLPHAVPICSNTFPPPIFPGSRNPRGPEWFLWMGG